MTVPSCLSARHPKNTKSNTAVHEAVPTKKVKKAEEEKTPEVKNGQCLPTLNILIPVWQGENKPPQFIQLPAGCRCSVTIDGVEALILQPVDPSECFPELKKKLNKDEL
jgi:hypothetical protein